ncbi:hypothetical protein AADY36_09690 [Pseudoalteromonas sp. D15MCD-2]|uniref:hypothetical protein n=1 Tax=Pseudoalteromonas sp. D15MCD-2 TaxID=3138933 RepID=UPI003158DD64
MKLWTPLIAIFLSGCVSSVKPLNDYGEYAPTNASSEEWFTVSYLAEGASFVQESRRKDAYKKMYEHCDGKYELRDSVRSGGDSAFIGSGENMSAFYNSKEVTFVFRCV